MTNNLFLDGLPIKLIEAAYAAAPGNEISRGKFASADSSAALVANAFGLFLDKPNLLPNFPSFVEEKWVPQSVQLEAEVRFPWAGGMHPWLDVFIETPSSIIGVESKRYEPFRSKRTQPRSWSKAYWRGWGTKMEPYESVRDRLNDGTLKFLHLDAPQLVKHAFGLRTESNRKRNGTVKKPILFYVFAEPKKWSGGSPIEEMAIARHRAEIAAFADMVYGSEVEFRYCSYREILTSWSLSPSEVVRLHTMALANRFDLYR